MYNEFQDKIPCDGKRVVSKKTAKKIIEILGSVVSRGTGKNAELKLYKTRHDTQELRNYI